MRMVPLSGLVRAGASDANWHVIDASPRFLLDAGVSLHGWFLFRTKLVCRTSERIATLYFEMPTGTMEVDVPASHKGEIRELVFVPAGTTRILWAPLRATGEIKQHPVCFVRMSIPERLYRMLRRVLGDIWGQPSARLKSLGLNLRTALTDIGEAYGLSGRLRTHAAAPEYSEWDAQRSSLTEWDRALIERHIETMDRPPRFVMLVDMTDGDSETLEATLVSLRAQYYKNFECLLMPGSAMPVDRTAGIGVLKANDFASWLEDVEDEAFIWIVRAGDTLPEHALYWMASRATPGVRVVYADDDHVVEGGARVAPRFKPDWSPELLRSTDYIGHAVALRASVLQSLGQVAEGGLSGMPRRALLKLQTLSGPSQVDHIPAVLFHARSSDLRADAVGVQSCLAATGVAASVEEYRLGCNRVRYLLPEHTPKVSVLVPTRDAVDLVRQCVGSVLEKSSYLRYEVLILDNRSTDAATLAYLASVSSDPRVRVVRYDAPFNFAAINNFAARHAEGEVLCLLNNDTEVISPDWMEEMLGHLLQEKVGVVGAKLLYPDGRVQHGGDVVGIGGVANHLHAFLGRDDPGYCNRAIVAQDLSAVTAACMMTWRKLYLDLGGMDAQNLPVAFNDVDYCLRVRESGHRVVWTPHALLYHHESVSRGKDDTPAKKARAKKEVAYMRRRWDRELQGDPFYNPNLSYQRADFSLSHAPLVRRPWHK